jgi:putative heme iron utilization protein
VPPRRHGSNLEELKRAVERKPDAYLSELAKQFDCSESGIFRALERMKITVKKSNSRTQNNHQ